MLSELLWLLLVILLQPRTFELMRNTSVYRKNWRQNWVERQFSGISVDQFSERNGDVFFSRRVILIRGPPTINQPVTVNNEGCCRTWHWLNEKKEKGVQSKKFRHGWQNYLLRVQRKILRKKQAIVNDIFFGLWAKNF